MIQFLLILLLLKIVSTIPLPIINCVQCFYSIEYNITTSFYEFYRRAVEVKKDDIKYILITYD